MRSSGPGTTRTPSPRLALTVERNPRAALGGRSGQKYTKDQILEAYLNIALFRQRNICSSSGRYCQRQRKAQLVQSALLAGIVKNPWRFDPTNGDTSTKKKQFRRAALAVATWYDQTEQTPGSPGGRGVKEEADQAPIFAGRRAAGTRLRSPLRVRQYVRSCC
jgi:hypothetical protein